MAEVWYTTEGTTCWIEGFPFVVGNTYPVRALPKYSSDRYGYYSASNAKTFVKADNTITYVKINALYQPTSGTWANAPIRLYVTRGAQNGTYGKGGWIKASQLGPKLTKYTIAYNGNNGASVTGGTTISNIPASTTKYKGVNATISTTKPTSSNKAISDTVNFNANGGTSTGDSDNKITATRTLKFTFKNWNTHYYGTGNAYASGATYKNDASTTLYAIWTPGLVSASKVTLPTPTRAGYAFKGWYTKASDGERKGGAGDTYTFSSSTSLSSQSTTLYAQWNIIDGSLYWNAGSAYSAPTGTPKNDGNCNGLVSVYSHDNFAAYNGTALTGSYNITTTNYNSWNTTTLFNAPAGYHHSPEETQWKIWNYTKGKWISMGASAASLNFNSFGSANLTWGDTLFFFANWLVNTYAVTFNANGGSGEIASISMTYGVAKTLPENTFTRTGYKFIGWATSAGGSKIYDNKQTVSNLTTSNNVTVTLYAVWEPIHYHIQFNDNSNGEAEGNVDSMLNLTYDQLYTLPSTQVYTRKRYYPNGWNTAANGSGIAYPDGLEVRNLTNVDNEIVTLYAQWIKEESSPVYIKVNDVWKEGTLYIKKDGEWKQGTVWIKKDGQYTQI